MVTVQKTVAASAYLLGIQRESMNSDLYKVIYTLLNKYVSDTQVPARAKWMYPAYPDKDIESGAISYPIIILNSPEASWEKLTLDWKNSNFRLDVEIFSTKTKDIDILADEVKYAMLQMQMPLRDLEIYFVNLDNEDGSFIAHQGIRVHIKRLGFTMKFKFSRTTT